MRNCVWVLILSLLLVPAMGAVPPQEKGADAPPFWAYPTDAPNTPAAAVAPDDGTVLHIPGSTQGFTISQMRLGFSLPDWHPEDHPPMPEVVSRGRQPDVRPCGYCHLPNGQGRPENSSMAGLPAAYIVQQMEDFKSGARKTSEPRMGPQGRMLVIAKASSDAEMKAAADYFASLKPKQWIRVVESTTVPKTDESGSMLIPSKAGGAEPLGQRIIEMPENLERTEFRDSFSGFVAYVPVGSIAKGQGLVTTGGGGKTVQCGICHGPDLKGLGPIPSIAGRSPSYVFRQLYDIKHGSRNGPWAALMKAAVAKLSQEDMLNIAAYLASRNPAPLASAAATTAATAAPAASPIAGGANSLAAKGKTLFNQYQCYDCHGMQGEGTTDGPDLIGTRLSGDEISKFLQKPSADATTKGMPDFPASSPDLAPLVAYVLTLKQTR